MPANIAQAVAQAIGAFSRIIREVGNQTEFRLRSGEVFTIYTAAHKRSDENLTAGIQQLGFQLKFMASDWTSAAPPGRAPEKGDQVVHMGRRHAIEWAKLISYNDTPIGWIVQVLG